MKNNCLYSKAVGGLEFEATTRISETGNCAFLSGEAKDRKMLLVRVEMDAI